jgi:hypothetical protein
MVLPLIDIRPTWLGLWNQEFFVDKIIDHKPWGRGRRHLVSFQGYPDTFNRWLSGSDLEGDSELAKYLMQHPL